MTAAGRSMCRSCGGAHGGEPVCPACRVPTVAPFVGEARVGRVARQPGALRSRIALCIGDDGAMASVVVKKDELARVDQATFDSWEPVTVPGPEVRSAAGRVMRADIARADGAVRGRWSDDLANRAAWALATADVGSRRGAIVDFIRLGLHGHVDQLGLSPAEVSWCRAVLAAQDQDVEALLRAVVCLPAGGYTERGSLLMATASLWLKDSDARRRVSEHMDSLPWTNAEIDAIRAAAAGTSGGACIRAARALLPGVRFYRSPRADDFEGMISGAEQRQMVKPPAGLEMPCTTALGAYLRGTNGVNVDRYAHVLGPLGPAQLDDLVDAGTLTAAALPDLAIEGEDAIYLRCRLDPASVPIGDVYSVRFVAEYARRLFRLGDGARLALFPKGYADADHYRALLDLRNSQGVGPRDSLRPAARRLFEVVDEFRERLKDDPSATPPKEILDDPTTWSLLRNEAFAGKLRPGPDLRRSHPRFMTWLELCDLQRLLFEGDWAGVREQGRGLVHKLDEEKLRDEALNLMAYASYVTGDVDGAMAMLEEALAGRYTEALVVNASIVAAEFGAARAAAFLGKVFDEAPDQDIKFRALVRALDIWKADPNIASLPAVTARCLRALLSAGLDDDTDFHKLVQHACDFDREWLAASAGLPTVSTAQREALQLYTTKARWLGEKLSVEDWAQEVVRQNKLPEPHSWARQELTTMMRDLMKAVHCPFGEAPGLMPPIRVLADGGVLPLLEDTVLRVQAVTHIAVFLETEQGDSISPDIEQRYLFLPFERFKAEESTLPADTVDLVKSELEKCVTVSAMSLAVVTEKEFNEFARAWDNLVARERWDHQNRAQILRAERALLVDIEAMVERCRRYVDRMERLPVERDLGKDLLVTIRSSIQNWNALLTRLRATL